MVSQWNSSSNIEFIFSLTLVGLDLARRLHNIGLTGEQHKWTSDAVNR